MDWRRLGLSGALWAVLLGGCPGVDRGDSGTDGTSGATAEATGGESTSGGEGTSGGESTSGGEGTTGLPTTGGASTTGGPAGACGEYAAALKHSDEVWCPCAVEAGFAPDLASCLDGSATESAPYVACLCELEEADPAHAEYVACMTAAEEGYATCTSPLSCDELVDLGPQELECNDTFLGQLRLCAKASPATALVAEEKCEDFPPFVCGSGEAIAFSFMCDGEADCMDMSDESEETCQF